MSMGHRDKLIDGDEYDAVSGWRRYLKFKPGQRKAAKNAINRRDRRRAKREGRRDTTPDLETA